jgi:cell division protein FtsB
MEDTMAKSLHEYKMQTIIDRETIKRLTKENEILKTEMKTLQGQLQNQYVRTKELIDEAK